MAAAIDRETDLRWLRRSLALARRGGSAVQPNPLVGAVLVKDGQILGEGWHRALGEPHAEVAALSAARQAGADPRGTTLYISLEPCHRQGRTPPCTEAILAAGIARVVYAMDDPNPAERGRSRQLLVAAGVEVRGDLMPQEGRALNAVYVHRQETGLPFVVLKSAMTLNGMLARADGSSRWITGEAARRQGHALRAGAGAVAVGGETARRDRPRLDLRLLAGEAEKDREAALATATGASSGQATAAGPELDDEYCPPPLVPPRPVVFDSDPPRCPVDLDWAGRRPILLLPEGGRAGPLADDPEWTLLEVPRGEAGSLDLAAALSRLAGEEIACLLVEGGGRLLTALLEARLWQRWELFVAPRLFPADGRPLWTALSEREDLRLAGCRPCGEDWRITLTPRRED